MKNFYLDVLTRDENCYRKMATVEEYIDELRGEVCAARFVASAVQTKMGKVREENEALSKKNKDLQEKYRRSLELLEQAHTKMVIAEKNLQTAEHIWENKIVMCAEDNIRLMENARERREREIVFRATVNKLYSILTPEQKSVLDLRSSESPSDRRSTSRDK